MTAGLLQTGTQSGIVLLLLVLTAVVVLALLGLTNKWRWLQYLGGVQLLTLSALVVAPVAVILGSMAVQALAAPVAGLFVLATGFKTDWSETGTAWVWLAGLDGVKIISVASLLSFPVVIIVNLLSIPVSPTLFYAFSTAVGGLLLLFSILVVPVSQVK